MSDLAAAMIEDARAKILVDPLAVGFMDAP